MTIRALYSAASGMDANEFSLDTIANNLANAGTTAFKRSRADFEDLFYEHLKLPGAQDAGGGLTPNGIAVGLGTRVGATQVDHRNGPLTQTQQPLDIAISGPGFFQVQDPGGPAVYTRAGRFTLNAEGQIVLAAADSGRYLIPQITIPEGAMDITITDQGQVTYRDPAASPGTVSIVNAGEIQLANFVNPAGLIQIGDTLFASSDASGTATPGTPGVNGLGTLNQGFLEASNVEPVRELVDLIKTQRNFELNSQAVQAADQMMQLLANLRRY